MTVRNRLAKCLASLALVTATGCTTDNTRSRSEDSPQPAATRPSTRPSSQPATTPALPPYEKDIRAFEAADQKNPPKPGGIVFYGSSSIRMWKSLQEDFPKLNVINRGFGGSTAPDALRYLDRAVIPYKPSTVVVYEGDNDLNKGRTPEQFLADCQTLATRVHKALPETRVLFVAIKPSLKRANQLPQQAQANKLVEQWVQASNDPRLGYIDVVTPMMGEDGKPRPELFVSDGLHMTPAGYEVWVEAVRPHLAKND